MRYNIDVKRLAKKLKKSKSTVYRLLNNDAGIIFIDNKIKKYSTYRKLLIYKEYKKCSLWRKDKWGNDILLYKGNNDTTRKLLENKNDLISQRIVLEYINKKNKKDKAYMIADIPISYTGFVKKDVLKMLKNGSLFDVYHFTSKIDKNRKLKVNKVYIKSKVINVKREIRKWKRRKHKRK